jgi:hypothetical protein
LARYSLVVLVLALVSDGWLNRLASESPQLRRNA